MDEDIKTSNTTEIDEALNEFQAQNSQKGQNFSEVQKTSVPTLDNELGIEFEDYNKMRQSNLDSHDDMPRIVKLVVKLSGGAIRSKKTAEYVLLVFVVVVFLISLFLVFGGVNKSKSPQLSPTQLEEMKKLMPVGQ